MNQNWISVEDRLPENEDDVLVVVSGKYGNITFETALELASYTKGDGWILEIYPEGENPKVTHWQYLPQPPKGDESCGL